MEKGIEEKPTSTIMEVISPTGVNLSGFSFMKRRNSKYRFGRKRTQRETTCWEKAGLKEREGKNANFNKEGKPWLMLFFKSRNLDYLNPFIIVY